MKQPLVPAWINNARWYISVIGGESAEPVRVFDASGREEVSSESPGTLFLRLEPRSRSSPRMRVFDAGDRETGEIDRDRRIPGSRYAMRRDGDLVWRLSIRSLVRKRHALALADGTTWTIDTPFFWWQQLTGECLGVRRLVGGYLHLGVKWAWDIRIEPGLDSPDLLVAVAFLHRQWYRL